MLAYKVIRRLNGKLVSALIRPESTAFTRYRKKKWIRANLHCRKSGYHLLVFNNLENAKRFAWEWCNDEPLEIWKVACRGKLEEIPAPCDTAVLNRYGTFYPAIDVDWSNGTLMCRKIKLIKRVGIEIPWRLDDGRRNHRGTAKRLDIVVSGRLKKAIKKKRI